MEPPSLLFSSLLRCPLTRLPVRLVLPSDFAEVGLAIGFETLGWTGALVRADGRAAYPVRGGIPVLLAEELHSLRGEASFESEFI